MLKLIFNWIIKNGNWLSTRYTSLMENVDNVFMQPIVQKLKYYQVMEIIEMLG